MSDKQVRDEAVTLFLAGHDTTANTLNWTWFMLATHPEIQEKVWAEVDSVLSGRTPTADDLQRMPYLRMVLQEGLRLYAPTWSGAWKSCSRRGQISPGSRRSVIARRSSRSSSNTTTAIGSPRTRRSECSTRTWCSIS